MSVELSKNSKNVIRMYEFIIINNNNNNNNKFIHSYDID